MAGMDRSSAEMGIWLMYIFCAFNVQIHHISLYNRQDFKFLQVAYDFQPRITNAYIGPRDEKITANEHGLCDRWILLWGFLSQAYICSVTFRPLCKPARTLEGKWYRKPADLYAYKTGIYSILTKYLVCLLCLLGDVSKFEIGYTRVNLPSGGARLFFPSGLLRTSLEFEHRKGRRTSTFHHHHHYYCHYCLFLTAKDGSNKLTPLWNEFNWTIKARGDTSQKASSPMDDTRYICPRPRASRACIPCKKHKTRCLPSSNSGHCRRYSVLSLTGACDCKNDSQADAKALGRYACIVIVRSRGIRSLYGMIWKYGISWQLTTSGDRNARSKACPEKPERTPCEVDSVLERLPPAALDVQYEDESDKVLQLHSGLFGCNETTNPHTTARNQANVDESPKKLSLSMSQANRMVESFQKRQDCFPFVVIPENTTAEELCRQRPFLLLSILVVMSDVDPGLQRSLDARFRKVVATRVVMQGEKSLDYLQGLLVYLAWFVQSINWYHPILPSPLQW